MKTLSVKDCEVFRIDGLEARITFDPARRHNLMMFTFEDTTVHVSDDAGTEIGQVCGVLGGGLEIHDNRSRKIYKLTAPALWDAFERALQAAARKDQTHATADDPFEWDE